jgi:hypothetical protein
MHAFSPTLVSNIGAICVGELPASQCKSSNIVVSATIGCRL